MLRGIDFRALECFVVLAEELHFRRAAERLNMTQPSLSARVKASRRKSARCCSTGIVATCG